jgi:uncharacterized protein (DUF2147 family)
MASTSRNFELRFLWLSRLAFCCAFTTAAVAGEGLDGFWMDSDGEVILEIGPCGAARCGKVAWLKQPLGPDGRALRDYRNPNPALQMRPVCGLEVASGFRKNPDGTWGEGTVYISDMGTSYSGYAQILSPVQIKVTGYVGFTIFGASETWTKVSGPFEHCSANARSLTNSQWTTKVIRAPALRSVLKSKDAKAPSDR